MLQKVIVRVVLAKCPLLSCSRTGYVLQLRFAATLAEVSTKNSSPSSARKKKCHDVLSLHALSSREVIKCLVDEVSLTPGVEDLVSIVCKFTKERDLSLSLRLFSYIQNRGLDTHRALGNYVVSMLVNVGSIANAQKVFDLLSSKSECSWNALINGYVRSGEFNRALILYKHMLEDSKHPSSFTFVALLRVCTRKKNLNTGRDLHAGIAKEGLLQSNVFVGNALIDMYAKCGSLREAQEVFDVLPVRNVVTWTALIAGYAFNSQAEVALKYFEKMRHDNVVPNAVTYASTLKACGCTKNLKLGKEIHAETEQKGILQTNQYVGNALVDMYARCGMLAKAKSVFSKLKVRDRVSWNALIAGHVEQEQGKKALILYKQMRSHGVSPDVITYTCALRACGTIGAIDDGIQIHNELKESGVGKKDMFIGSALVDMYSKCGALVKADEVFNQLPSPDALTWTALITGYAQQAEIDIALSYFDRMRKAGVKPDQITFLSVLTACNHAGLVDKGEQYYEVMWKDYGLSPSIKHHSCLVDLLGRAGQLDRLMTIMNKTPFQPTMVMWLNVMTACRKWGDVHLGRQAFEQAIRLDNTESAAYVCMANIYADAGMYENAKEIEGMIMTE